MQNLNAGMTAMARVLHELDNGPALAASNELAAAIGQLRATFWKLKATYPNYANDQPYHIADLGQGDAIVIYGKSQVPETQVVVVEEGGYYPTMIILDDDDMI